MMANAKYRIYYVSLHFFTFTHQSAFIYLDISYNTPLWQLLAELLMVLSMDSSFLQYHVHVCVWEGKKEIIVTLT